MTVQAVGKVSSVRLQDRAADVFDQHSSFLLHVAACAVQVCDVEWSCGPESQDEWAEPVEAFYRGPAARARRCLSDATLNARA